jgi:predicted amidohydrolase
MNDRLNVAVVQLAAHDRDHFSRSAPQILESLRTVARNGAQLIVCPEGTFPSYILGPRPLDVVEYRRFIDEIEALAREFSVHIICGGVHVSSLHELPENAAFVFGPNGLIAAAGKRFLWHFDRHWYRAGASLDPISTSIGNLGILVCADGRIPTFARALVDRGANILIIPTAWVSNASNTQNYENIQADLLARMRAWENGVPVIAANKSGAEYHSVLYCGKSQIIDAEGNVTGIATHDEAETLQDSIVLKEPKPRRSRLQRSPIEQAPIQALKTIRCAYIAHCDQASYDVASWSDVDLIFTSQRSKSVTKITTTVEGKFRATKIVDIEDVVSTGTIHPEFLSAIIVDDEEISDPGVLPQYRQAGIACILWRMHNFDAAKRLQLARTRAIELRSYVLAIAGNSAERSFIVDPDGAVLGGTTEQLRAIQWMYDPHRVINTSVAPATDILSGLAIADIILE